MLASAVMTREAKGPASAAKRVLIVEDNPLNRRLFSAMLAAEGYLVLEAADGPSALAVADERRPDLIVMDVNLPGTMSGLDVTRRLKAESDTSDIPVIATSAYRESGDAEVAASGCDGFMAKPIGVSEFLERVEAFMKRAPGRYRQGG
jgi:two-component system cell cycle response regulator DivK